MKPNNGFVLSMLLAVTLIAGCGGGGSSGKNENSDRGNSGTQTSSQDSAANDNSAADDTATNNPPTEQPPTTPPTTTPPTTTPPTTTPPATTPPAAFDAHAFYAANVAPRLQFCTTCHVVGGLADTDAGRTLLLSTNTANDYDNFQTAWRALGGGTTANPILKNNADPAVAHSGGKSWPVNGDAYNDVSKLFSCWNDPASCASSPRDNTPPRADTSDTLPLLEIGPKKAPLVAGCDGKPDDTPLPLDPRSLVVEGINKPGVAVQFNAYWIDVHNPLPPFRPNPLQPAKTCGEWKARVADGEHFIKHTSQFLGGIRFFRPKPYRELWKSWGLKQRPANFDDEVLKRYGLFKADYRNPYPLDGEDPNLTEGGSGQLPLGLGMVKNPEGHYTGEIAVNCSFCHDSRVGTDEEGQPFHWGRGSNFMDVGVFVNDFAKRVIGIPAVVPYPFGGGAGVSNALGVIDVLYVLFDAETLSVSPGAEFFPSHGSAGQMKAPNWWSRAWMTRLFKGAVSSDNVRSTMALEVANFMMTGEERRNMEPTFENVTAFLNSLQAPAYPHPEQIDTHLAEAGAVLFHTKDLWANGNNATIPRPNSNGSCAGCHGVYSPRYAADATMLPDPRLKGVAGVTTPIEIIRTDSARTNVMSDPMKVAWNSSWWGYDELNPEWTREGQGRPGTTLQRLRNDIAGGGQRLEGPNRWSDLKGYTAPPLYGVWAAAPYFHNGSVPTVWDVLKPSDRPGIWAPPQREAVAPGLNKALDYSLNAYDLQKLGWRYEEIPCAAGTEKFNCNPTNAADRLLSWLSNRFGSKFWLGYQVLPPMTKKDMEARRIINTHEYSRGNEGHDFTEMLTDAERYALIEYLKTL